MTLRRMSPRRMAQTDVTETDDPETDVTETDDPGTDVTETTGGETVGVLCKECVLFECVLLCFCSFCF